MSGTDLLRINRRTQKEPFGSSLCQIRHALIQTLLCFSPAVYDNEAIQRMAAPQPRCETCGSAVPQGQTLCSPALVPPPGQEGLRPDGLPRWLPTPEAAKDQRCKESKCALRAAVRKLLESALMNHEDVIALVAVLQTLTMTSTSCYFRELLSHPRLDDFLGQQANGKTDNDVFGKSLLAVAVSCDGTVNHLNFNQAHFSRCFQEGHFPCVHS